MMQDPNVLNSLPTAEPNPVRAYLLTYDTGLDAARAVLTELGQPATGFGTGGLVWRFLLNPEEIRWSRSADYADYGTPATNSQGMFWKGTNNPEYDIPVRLETWYEGRHCQPLLDGLEALMEAKFDQDRRSPPILTFRWGKRRIAPCVLTNISGTETAWLDGYAASASFRITLSKVSMDAIVS